MRKLLLLFCLFLLLGNVFAVIDHGELTIFAVTTSGQGLSAGLVLDIEPGSGKIWTSTTPLVGTTTQTAAINAVDLAKKYSSEVNDYDYKFSINSTASVVEGPSAGSAMALLLVSMLNDKPLPSNVSITGTISREGYIGPVGGVYEKTKEAARIGIDLFMIPKGEAKQTVRIDSTVRSINLLEYGPNELGIKVIDVATLDDAMEYAFSDIGQIDVNSDQSLNVPDFIPENITYESQLLPMKELTAKYIQNTEQLIKGAKNSLSTTLIDDSELVLVLLETIKVAEENLQMAEILNDQNYLYSAANYTFLAKVNTLMIRDVSVNPSILESNSTVFNLKVGSLYQDLKDLKQELGEYTPIDNLEWHVAAQQRLSWAENKVRELQQTEVIVIGGTDYSVALDAVQRYEFALAWYEAADDFFKIADASSKRVLPRETFKDAMDEFILQTEDGLTAMDEAEAEGIKRRLDAAKREKANGWYLSSVFNAASAYALLVGENDVKDKSREQLDALLRSKINEIDGKITASGHEFVWANLYLDHAKYYLESADYYGELDHGASVVNSLEAGISLAYLAEQLFLVSDEFNNHYRSIPESEYISVTPGTGTGATGQQDFDPVMVLVYASVILVLLLVSFLLLANLIHARTYKHYSLPSEIKRVRQLRQKLDNDYAKGRISEERHAYLSAKYSEELAELNGMKEKKVEHIYKADDLKAELTAFEKKSKALRRHYNQGILSKDEFNKRKEYYMEKVGALKKQLRGEQLEMQIEKAELIKFKENGNKAPAMAPKGKSMLPVKVGKEQLVVAKPKPVQQKPVALKPMPAAKPRPVQRPAVQAKPVVLAGPVPRKTVKPVKKVKKPAAKKRAVKKGKAKSGLPKGKKPSKKGAKKPE